MAAVGRRIRRSRRYRQALPRPRVFRDRFNPLENLEPDEVFDRYRFRPRTIVFLVGQLQDLLVRGSHRNCALPPLLQVLLYLRFLATGAFLILVGDSLNISESATGRACRDVARAINQRLRHHIAFPTGDKATRVMEGFRRIAGFPEVIGCGDGTQIRIQAPDENEVDFVNRKGFHSLNVQAVCDPNFRVTSVCAKWPGSAHDSRIWKESALGQQFENGVHHGLILGDSAYACTKYLMTPYAVPSCQAEENFNSSLCRTRVHIEQTFGIIKRRFSALHVGLRTSPHQAVDYILSTFTLHNVGLDMGDVLTSNDFNEINLANCNDNYVCNIINHDGAAKRNDIARRVFNY